MTTIRAIHIRAVHERLDGLPHRIDRLKVSIPVMLTLEDGREVQSNHWCSPRQVDAFIAQLPREVDILLRVDDVEHTIAMMPLDHHGTEA